MDASPTKLAIAVIGVGSMGRHHARLVAANDRTTLTGIYDPDPCRAQEIADLYNCRIFDSLNGALSQSQAVCIAAPTSLHVHIGRECLNRGLHVLMEKPLADNPEGAAELVEAARKAHVVLMVGHVERYNPATQKLFEMLRQSNEEILSIDIHRLTPFDGSRCMDVDVLYDLMIHDVDLALDLAKAPVKIVHAAARKVFSDKNDMAHTLITFYNGVIASLWTGKCSPRKLREITVSTRSRQYVLDTLNKTLTLHVAEEMPAQDLNTCFMGKIEEHRIPIEDGEPLGIELDDFVSALLENKQPIVDGSRALESLRVLEMIRAEL